MSKRKTLQKTPQEERAVVLGQPNKRPYGVRVRIHLQTAGALGYVEEVCVSLHTGAFLSIAPTRTAPWEGGKKYVVTMLARRIRAFFPIVSDARPTAAAKAKCPSARLESAATARRARTSARA